MDYKQIFHALLCSGAYLAPLNDRDLPSVNSKGILLFYLRVRINSRLFHDHKMGILRLVLGQ